MFATKVSKVQARGQITLPKEIREAIDCKPGDTVIIQPKGKHCAEIQVIPRMTFDEMLEKWHIETDMDWHRMRDEAEAAQADEYMRKLEADLERDRRESRDH